MIDTTKVAVENIFNALILSTTDPAIARNYTALLDNYLDQVGQRHAEVAEEAKKARTAKETQLHMSRATAIAGALPAVARDLKSTIDAFKRGDSMSGSAGIMDICATATSLLGKLADASSLAGPLGAFASAIFSIIGLVLRSFGPKEKSIADQLEERLRKIGAEDKGQIAHAAIDEFEALAASYPKEGAAGPIKIHRYLDALSQGNARDNLLKSNYWLREKNNFAADGWMEVLESTLEAARRETENLVHLIGLADRTASDYEQLFGVYRVIAGQHLKMMSELRSVMYAKGLLIYLGTHDTEQREWYTGTKPYYREERGSKANWTRNQWKYHDPKNLTGNVRTLAFAEDPSDSLRYLVGLQTSSAEGKFQPFHHHGQAYGKTFGTWPDTGTEWERLETLDNACDVWAYPASQDRWTNPSVGSAGVVVLALTDETTMKRYTLVHGKSGLQLTEILTAIPAGDGATFNNDKFRSVRCYPSASSNSTVYFLVERAIDEFVIQVGNNANQFLHLPENFNPRGIAVDDERIWVYRDLEKETGHDAELLCMTHEQAMKVQAAPDQNRANSRWNWRTYNTTGERFLNRGEDLVEGVARHAGITYLAGERCGVMTMCFNGRICTGLVREYLPGDGATPGGYVRIDWAEYDPSQTAMMAIQTPVKLLPLFLKRLDILTNVLQESVEAV